MRIPSMLTHYVLEQIVNVDTACNQNKEKPRIYNVLHKATIYRSTYNIPLNLKIYLRWKTIHRDAADKRIFPILPYRATISTTALLLYKNQES